MIRVTRHGKVLHIGTDIGSISIHDEVLRSCNPSFETRILCYLADYLEKQSTTAAPGIDLATAWAEGYRSGVTDERISESNIGIAGFGAKIEPARANPYMIDAIHKGGVSAQDAARYRWLRDKAMMGSRHDPAVLKDGPTDCCEFMFGEELDAAIDADMKTTSHGAGEN